MSKVVLIIEDDIDIQQYYKIVLADLGLEILQAYNGKEALSIIDSGKNIDLIILDLVMPVMGGVEFLEALRRERKSEIPVIISTVDKASALKLEKSSSILGIFLKLDKQDNLLKLVRTIND